MRGELWFKQDMSERPKLEVISRKIGESKRDSYYHGTSMKLHSYLFNFYP
jgi:hypothetical protein